jgi:hypothetical protein
MKYSVPLFVLAILGILLLPGSSAQYGILASPDKTAYNPGQMIILTAYVPDDSLITFQVSDPDGNIIIVKTAESYPSLETDPTLVEEGRVGFNLALDAVIGVYSYSITAVSDDGSENAMVSGSFEVKAEPVDESDESLIPFLPVPMIAGTLVVVGFFRKRLAI